MTVVENEVGRVVVMQEEKDVKKKKWKTSKEKIKK